MPDSNRKVLVIGWDAADWKVINTLIEQNKMPHTAALIERGVMGNLATLQLVLSPMLWTSIATGKWPFKHGILGFTELTPDGAGHPQGPGDRPGQGPAHHLGDEDSGRVQHRPRRRHLGDGARTLGFHGGLLRRHRPLLSWLHEGFKQDALIHGANLLDITPPS